MKKIALAFAALSLAALSACGIPQSPECAAYIECAAHYDEVMDSTTDMSTFEADGSCWATAETATACTTSCEAGLDSFATALTAAGEDVGPCGEGGGGDGGTADAG